MTTARDIMSSNTECAQVTDNLAEVAKKMRDLDVGALPICGEDNRLKGMITDRDIVVKCVADGGDPNSTTVESFVEEIGGVGGIEIGQWGSRWDRWGRTSID